MVNHQDAPRRFHVDIQDVPHGGTQHGDRPAMSIPFFKKIPHSDIPHADYPGGHTDEWRIPGE